MSDLGEAEVEGDLRMSPEAADLCRDQQEARDQYHGSHDAPPPRRKSFSKLRRRLSQTFRFSFNGSLSEFSTAWPGGEDGGGDRANGERPPWDSFLIVGWSSLEAS